MVAGQGRLARWRGDQRDGSAPRVGQIWACGWAAMV